jgi:cell division protein FtsB
MNKLIDYKKRTTKIKKIKSLSSQAQKTITTFIITLGILIVIFGAFFLWLTSQNSSKGNSLEQNRRENDQLKAAKEALLNRIIRYTSSDQLESSEKIQTMIDPEEILYVSPDDNKI